MKVQFLLVVIISFFLLNSTAQDFVEITENGWNQGIKESKPTFADIDSDGLMDMIIGDDKGHLLHFEIISAGSNEIQMITKKFNDIDVGYNAAPAIIDLDNDGLVDLLIGHAWGTIYHYEQNSPSSTIFNFITDQFNSIVLYDDITMAFCDLDENGKLDMAIGYNLGNGTSGLDHYEQSNPGSTNFVYISSNFGNIGNILQNPVPTLFDLDNDNKIDLLLGNYYGSIHHYEQDSQNSGNFTLITESFLENTGNNIYHVAPQITNLNADNILELIVGEFYGKLMLYQQEAQNANQFELITENMNRFDVGINSSPVMKDINNDGLYDILVGTNTGTLWHFIQSEENENTIVPESQNFAEIQVDGAASLCITDIDNDNLNDILVANMGSSIFRFEQESTNSFTFLPLGALSNIYEEEILAYPSITDFENDNLLDLIYTYGYEAGGFYLSYLKHYRQSGVSSDEFELVGNFYSSYSDLALTAEFGDIDNNGLLDQLDTGNGYQSLSHREQSNAGSLIFDFVSVIPGIEGENLNPFLYDFDNDGDLDIITGDMTGGLRLFENQLINSTENIIYTTPYFVKVNHNTITVRQLKAGSIKILIYNLLGQQIGSFNTNQIETTIPIDGSESIYIIKIIGDNTSITKKVFIN